MLPSLKFQKNLKQKQVSLLIPRARPATIRDWHSCTSLAPKEFFRLIIFHSLTYIKT